MKGKITKMEQNLEAEDNGCLIATVVIPYTSVNDQQEEVEALTFGEVEINQEKEAEGK